MNPVLILARNAKDLTKQAIYSVLNQSIKVETYVIDNDSSDGTREMLAAFTNEWHVRTWRMTPAHGVSASWNFGLNYLFNTAGCEHVLVINNDVVLRDDTYRELLADCGLFVTAVSVDKIAGIQTEFVKSVRPHPDFSCFLIRREVWDKVGPFDESMVLYASDADYHLRMRQAGIEAYTIGLPFYHYASGTLKTATEIERLQINAQADRDRETFERKWGCKVGSESYYRMFNGSAP